MQHIYTTKSAVDTLKKTAKKTVKKYPEINLSAAYEQEAVKAGYQNYRHFNQSYKKSQLMELGWAPPLPIEYLARFEQHNSQLTTRTQSIFDNKVIFAFDLKDADDINERVFEELDDAWLLCGQDIVRLMLFSTYEDEPHKNKCAFSIYSQQENIEDMEHELTNYRFFIPTDLNTLIDAGDISTFLNANTFFWPRLIWHKGICLNIRKLR